MVENNMKLYFIGMGLKGFESCSIETLDILNLVDIIFIEEYTNFIIKELPSVFNHLKHKFNVIQRSDLEENDSNFLNKIKGKTVAILIPGDPFIATTHNSLRVKATQLGIKCRIVHNTSIISAAASISGLFSYNFGKIVTCPFNNNMSEHPYNIIRANKKINAHTLVLLDIDKTKEKFLSISEAILALMELEKEKKEGLFSKSCLLIGLAKIGHEDEFISVGTPEIVLNNPWESIGPPQALIVCADSLHFAEEEALNILWRIRSTS